MDTAAHGGVRPVRRAARPPGGSRHNFDGLDRSPVEEGPWGWTLRCYLSDPGVAVGDPGPTDDPGPGGRRCGHRTSPTQESQWGTRVLWTTPDQEGEVTGIELGQPKGNPQGGGSGTHLRKDEGAGGVSVPTVGRGVQPGATRRRGSRSTGSSRRSYTGGRTTRVCVRASRGCRTGRSGGSSPESSRRRSTLPRAQPPVNVHHLHPREDGPAGTASEGEVAGTSWTSRRTYVTWSRRSPTTCAGTSFTRSSTASS